MLDEQAISPRWSMKTVAGENIILHICISRGCRPALGGAAALQLVAAPAPSCRAAHPKPPRRLRCWMRADARGSQAMGKMESWPKCSEQGAPVPGEPRRRPAGPPRAARPLLAWARWDGARAATEAPLPRLSPAILLCPDVTGVGSKVDFLFIYSQIKRLLLLRPSFILQLNALYF